MVAGRDLGPAYPACTPSFSVKTLLTILVPASLVFLLGVYDDLRGVGPYFKFSVQALAAAMLFMGGLRIVNIPVLFGDTSCPGSSACLSPFSGFWPSPTPLT